MSVPLCPSSSTQSAVPLNGVLPCCSSSSSDEEVLLADSGGWPSVSSVLETPDRRRVRKSLRLTKRTVSLGPDSSLGNSSSTSSKFSLSSPASGQKRSVNGQPSSSSATDLNSPPLGRRMHPSTQFCSPTLRTPRQSMAIHMSSSPLRSFFIRERRQRLEGDSPRSSNPSSSDQPVLRPLNLHNYIGIRFCGEQPGQMTRTQIVLDNAAKEECSKGERQQKRREDENNGFVKERRRPRCSEDSGFFDSSSANSSSLLTGQSSTTIETPSKGLVSGQPSSSSCPFSSAFSSLSSIFHSTPNYSNQQFSPRLLLSPSHRPFPAPLSLEFGDHPDPSTSPSFHHLPIHEQSFGPLEASVVHGILNDWDRLQPGPSKGIQFQASPPKQAIPRPSPRALNFERKLQILRRRRESPRKRATVEWWRMERRATIPSRLFVEGIEDWREQWPALAGPEEFASMFPNLDVRQFQLMFGQTQDQLEVTRQARDFLLNGRAARRKRRRQAKRIGQNKPGGHTKSAGLPSDLSEETINKLE